MKRFVRLSLVAGLTLATAASWAKNEDDARLQSELCEGMLGHTLHMDLNHGFRFDLKKGLGARGFLGSYPEANAENMSRAAAQGVMYWGHSIAVRRTTIEAAHHDAIFNGLAKILYFISPVDVSDLHDESDPQVIRDRFTQIFNTSDLIYFEGEGHLQTLRKVPSDTARRLIHPQTIGYFSKDDRGPRFIQSGWTFPKIRGVLTYQNVFESGSGTIKNLLKYARGLEKKGYTITFNQNFAESLEKARDQVRLEHVGDVLKAIPDGSRYRGEAEYKMALDGYAKGDYLSVEVRDPQSRLVAGAIGQHNGNIWSFDTIFYDFTSREGDRFYTSPELAELEDARDAKSLIDLAKVAILASLLRLHDHGIDVVDAGMVTKFTAGLKGVYIDGNEFANHVDRLLAQPTITVDLNPFSFQAR